MIRAPDAGTHLVASNTALSFLVRCNYLSRYFCRARICPDHGLADLVYQYETVQSVIPGLIGNRVHEHQITVPAGLLGNGNLVKGQFSIFGKIGAAADRAAAAWYHIVCAKRDRRNILGSAQSPSRRQPARYGPPVGPQVLSRYVAPRPNP